MPRYAYITVRGASGENRPYIVRDEHGQVVAECDDRDSADHIRAEYDALRNIPASA